MGTFTTKALLREVLARNGWNQDEAFFSIDGGLMRDVSEGWAEVKRLAFLLEVPGFIDAYSSFQSHPASVAKEVCVDSAVRHNANLLIPTRLSRVASIFLAVLCGPPIRN